MGKAVMLLLNGCWNLLFSVPLFDLPFSFGEFVMALIVFDLALIWLRKILRKDDNVSSNSAPKNSATGGKK